MKSITAKDLHQKIIQGEEIVLIDVRESFEHQHYNIGGVNIPLCNIFESKEQFNINHTIVIYCQKGIRSQIAIQRLSVKFGYDQLINLQGGVDAWIKTFQNKKDDE